MPELSARTPEERYGPALRKAQEDLAGRDPHVLADWAGASYDASLSRFLLRYWDVTYTVSYPAGEVRDAAGAEPPIFTRVLLLHYLLNASGAPMADRWVAFREFPGGMGYDAAFQGRVVGRLARTFGQRLDDFRRVCQALGGVALSVGDAAYYFDVLPRLRVAVVLYRGDDEFPPAANFIFDGAADRYLPTEDLVVLGEQVTSRLCKYQA